MEGFKIAVLLVLFFSAISSAAHDVSVSCMMVYDQGGASAVLESSECPRWSLFSHSQNQTGNCQLATLQGRREYQEDRVTCNREMSIPFLGKDGPMEILVGVAAIFDGHGGKEASEMASKNFLNYFFLNVVFNMYRQPLYCKAELDFAGNNKDKVGHCSLNLASSVEGLPVSGNETMLEILKKALLRTIHDIDLKFSLEAINNRDVSGSTATVVLLIDDQVLVANVGDSRALLCSEKIISALGTKGTSVTVLDVEQLTRDHHPDREDERIRIEAAGGFVRTRGVPRVNGILSVSRSIGDVYLKRYGVIPVPEVTGWRHLTSNNSYLVVASDGIFESLTPQNVCDLLRDANIQGKERSKISGPLSASLTLADHIVNKAFEEGSWDNLSAVVIPLNTGSSQESALEKM